MNFIRSTMINKVLKKKIKTFELITYKKFLPKSNTYPKVTIVTLVYNDEKNIERTIKNILNQNYKNFEYIVLYTPSKDKTLKIIKKYQNKIDKIIIGYKRGIYENMNLATKFAEGEYINFMNCGDYFENNKIISNIFKNKNNAEVIYGNCKILYPNLIRPVKAYKLKNLKFEMAFTHQSSFVKTKLQKKFKFNTNYKYSADYDFFCKLYLKQKKFRYINKFISRRSAMGASDKNKCFTLLENYLISRKYFKNKIKLSDKLNYIFKIIFYYFANRFRLLLPSAFMFYLMKIKVKYF